MYVSCSNQTNAFLFTYIKINNNIHYVTYVTYVYVYVCTYVYMYSTQVIGIKFNTVTIDQKNQKHVGVLEHTLSKI